MRLIRKAQPMGGPAQRVAEAEPMQTPHDWQHTGVANRTGRTKSEEGTGAHVLPDAGEPKARASTDPPEARRLPYQSAQCNEYPLRGVEAGTAGAVSAMGRA